MTRCKEAEFDLVVGKDLDDLGLDASPRARAATDRVGRSDLECVAIYAANLGIGERPGLSVGRLQAVLEATVASQKLYPSARPRIIEGAGANFVEVDTPCGVGS